MTRTLRAVYERGVLRPLQPLSDLKENEEVTVTVSTQSPLLKHVGTLPDADAQEILKIIEQEFEQVDPNDWK